MTLPWPRLHRAQRFRLGAGKPIANQVVRVVDVLLDVVPQAARERLPARIEQLASTGFERPRMASEIIMPASVPNVRPLPAYPVAEY